MYVITIEFSPLNVLKQRESAKKRNNIYFCYDLELRFFLMKVNVRASQTNRRLMILVVRFCYFLVDAPEMTSSLKIKESKC